MLKKVTITGADDNTPICALVDLALQYPFVEWAILVSKKQEDGPRFPSRKWMDAFTTQVANLPINVSMHVCGEWVRQLMRGVLDFRTLPSVRIMANRVQINTHAEEHVSTVRCFEVMEDYCFKQFIIQLDKVNDHIFDAATARGLNVAGLFDCSHGAGALPAVWPTPVDHRRFYGYAGGLGPENVVEEIKKIAGARRNLDYWIDMEGRVRDQCGKFDLDKVRLVLERCAPFVNTEME